MEKVNNQGFIKTHIEPANQNELPQSNWALISEAANRFRMMSSITGVVYSRGSGDEIELVGQVHNVNSLFTIVMDRASEYVLSHFEGYSDNDAEFARGQLIDVTNHIVRSAWRSANGDFDLAKKYCESSVFLIKEIYENNSLKVDKKPYVAMTEEIEKYMVRASALVPCIETIIEINAIRNEEIKGSIMGGLTAQEMSLNIVNETINTAQTKVAEIMEEQGETEESLGEQRSRILNYQILGQVKRFFGMVMDKELTAMKESGVYESIYPKTVEAVKFFMPIVFPNKEDIQEQELEDQQDNTSANENYQADVEVDIPSEEIAQETVAEESVVEETSHPESDIPSFSQNELDQMRSLDRFKILAKIKKGEVKLIGGDSTQVKKVSETNPPVQKQSEVKIETPLEKEDLSNAADELPIYTQDEIDGMKTIERYKILAQIKQGKAMLIEREQEQGMTCKLF